MDKCGGNEAAAYADIQYQDLKARLKKLEAFVNLPPEPIAPPQVRPANGFAGVFLARKYK